MPVLRHSRCWRGRQRSCRSRARREIRVVDHAGHGIRVRHWCCAVRYALIVGHALNGDYALIRRHTWIGNHPRVSRHTRINRHAGTRLRRHTRVNKHARISCHSWIRRAWISGHARVGRHTVHAERRQANRRHVVWRHAHRRHAVVWRHALIRHVVGWHALSWHARIEALVGQDWLHRRCICCATFLFLTFQECQVFLFFCLPLQTKDLLGPHAWWVGRTRGYLITEAGMRALVAGRAAASLPSALVLAKLRSLEILEEAASLGRS